VPIFWLEKETCNSIASTTQNKFVTSFFKSSGPNWAILLLKYFKQPTICHLSHLTSTSGIWHNLKKKQRLIYLLSGCKVSHKSRFYPAKRVSYTSLPLNSCYDTLIDCCTSSSFMQCKSKSWLGSQEIHTWKH
jgi:hypothetical protein